MGRKKQEDQEPELDPAYFKKTVREALAPRLPDMFEQDGEVNTLCPNCDGTGVEETVLDPIEGSFKPLQCRECNGTGRKEIIR